MISGVCYPSFTRDAAWSSTGSWLADFPPSNLGLIDQPRRVAASGSAAANNITITLADAYQIDFLALVQHNAGPLATISVTLKAPGGATVYSTGNLAVEPSGVANRDYPQVRPVRFPSGLPVVKTIEIQLSANAEPWEIGSVEVGRFWQWPDVAVPREIGVLNRASSVDVGGLDHVTQQWAPRVVSGQRTAVTREELETTILDFQADMGLHRAFVWVWDLLGATTWAREAYLVTNLSLPEPTVSDVDSGEYSFEFREHLR